MEFGLPRGVADLLGQTGPVLLKNGMLNSELVVYTADDNGYYRFIS